MFIIDGIDEIFWSEEQVWQAIEKYHPELGDDARVEFFENHVSEDAPYLES